MSQMTDQQIKEAIRDEWKAIEQWDKLHDEKVEFHKKNIRNLEKQCTHEKTTYHPDPSGNNDSFRECNTCGKEF